MTHTSTEQERAPSAAPILRAMAENYPSGHLWDAQDAKTCQHAASEIERLHTELQAARRAQVVPVQPTSKQVVLGAAAILGQPEGTADNRDPNWKQAVEQAERAYLAMVAAASQPNGEVA